jgi:two-component system alkaline phosphatase synthesis response regulator PhoP
MIPHESALTELQSEQACSPQTITKPKKAKVLVVDDEEDIIEVISYNLEKEGYQVLRALSGEEAIEKVLSSKPDLVILDLMLPGIDGLDVCRELKQKPELSLIPIIMLSARGDEADIVSGLELGASDYITKPFSQRILSARIKSVLKRSAINASATDQLFEFHGITIHPGRHEVRSDGELLDLTASEFRLLDLLIRKPGWVFTRMQIVDAVRGEDCAVTARSVDVQVVGLRRKLGHKADLIETVRGVGYRVREDLSSFSLYLAG